MAEVGYVKEIKGNKVIVALERQEACSKCRACLSSIDSKEMILEAKNECHAKVGDEVNIYLKEVNFIKAVLIMYTIPLIALLVGILGTYFITYNELLSVVVGLILVAGVYLIIRKNDARFKNKDYTPIATSVVDSTVTTDSK
jgi:sigma-E factor negative regulatory protein RseC